MKSVETTANGSAETDNSLSENHLLKGGSALHAPAKKDPRDYQEEDIKKARRELISSDSEMLLSNRQDYLRFNRFKIDRNLITLSEIDRKIFLVIPRLLHVHQEGLPGYFVGNPPCGIHNFSLDKEAQIAPKSCSPISSSAGIRN